MKRARLSVGALAVAAVLAPAAARAHEMTMAEMELRETAPGQFMWQWTAVGNVPPSQELTPVWPEGCSSDVVAVEGAAS